MTREEAGIYLVRYNKYLLTCAFDWTNDRVFARDLVQDTCLKVLECVQQFSDKYTSFKVWVISIMRHLYIDMKRKVDCYKNVFIEAAYRDPKQNIDTEQLNEETDEAEEYNEIEFSDNDATEVGTDYQEVGQSFYIDPSTDSDALEQRDYVNSIMSRLRERDRKVLVMLAHGYSTKEIAEAFNAPISTALSYMRRARMRAQKIANQVA